MQFRSLTCSTGILALLNIYIGFIEATEFLCGRNEVSLSDGTFLLCDIARHIDHLHPVSQRFRDGLQDICCTDEQNLEQQSHCIKLHSSSW